MKKHDAQAGEFDARAMAHAGGPGTSVFGPIGSMSPLSLLSGGQRGRGLGGKAGDREEVSEIAGGNDLGRFDNLVIGEECGGVTQAGIHTA